MLKPRTEIATAVASALKVTLLEDVGAKVEVGETRNPPPSMRICSGPRSAARDGTAKSFLILKAAPQYATLYAQWGNRAKALEWLEMSLRLRDPGLMYRVTRVEVSYLAQA